MVLDRMIASKVPGKTMRECISRARTLVDIAKAAESTSSDAKPLGRESIKRSS